MKIASFTFDDGFINTAKIIKKNNIPSTFYIVTGWLLKTIKIEDSFNLNFDHGDIKDWIDLNVDLGCHTHDHKKTFDEIQSFDIYKNIFKPPYNLATPYGIKRKIEKFDSCKVGFFHPYNKLNKNNLKTLHSINPNFDFKNKHKEFLNYLKNAPEDVWIILTFHGINEGWEPTSLEYILYLFNFLLEEKYEIKTISEVVNELKGK